MFPFPSPLHTSLRLTDIDNYETPIHRQGNWDSSGLCNLYKICTQFVIWQTDKAKIPVQVYQFACFPTELCCLQKGQDY